MATETTDGGRPTTNGADAHLSGSGASTHDPQPTPPPGPSTRRLLARTLLWLAAGTAVALAGAAGLSVFEVGGVPLLAHTSHVPILADPNLARMRSEMRAMAAAGEAPDVMVVGSSHAYRGIDPRVFADAGWAAFNAGWSSQTPRISRTVLASLPGRPTGEAAPLVIVETYPVSAAEDGFEAFAALAATDPFDPLVRRLAPSFATPTTAVLLAGSAARHLAHRPAARALGRYAGRGFVAVDDVMPAPALAADATRSPATLTLSSDALADLVALRRVAPRVVFVEMPVSDALARHVSGYREASRAIEAAANAAGIPFIRLDAARLGLVAGRDFADADHLTAAAARRVTAVLLDTLTARRLLTRL